MTSQSGIRVLAVASRGGHWEQLMLVSEAFSDSEVFYITTDEELLKAAGLTNGAVVDDCNRNQPLGVLKSIFQCGRQLLAVRPHFIVSTGAAPGLICITLGRLMGARVMWIDSFANVEKLSMSGKLARYVANIWLTQWEHLATRNGPKYVGELL